MAGSFASPARHRLRILRRGCAVLLAVATALARPRFSASRAKSRPPTSRNLLLFPPGSSADSAGDSRPCYVATAPFFTTNLTRPRKSHPLRAAGPRKWKFARSPVPNTASRSRGVLLTKRRASLLSARLSPAECASASPCTRSHPPPFRAALTSRPRPRSPCNPLAGHSLREPRTSGAGCPIVHEPPLRIGNFLLARRHARPSASMQADHRRPKPRVAPRHPRLWSRLTAAHEPSSPHGGPPQQGAPHEFRSRELLTTTVVSSWLFLILFSFVAIIRHTDSPANSVPALLWLAILCRASLMLAALLFSASKTTTLSFSRLLSAIPSSIFLFSRS